MNFRLVANALRASRAAPAPVSLRSAPSLLAFAAQRRAMSSAHHQETFESFTARYVSFFQSVEDLFELQRGLNNCFAHDLVPAPAVIEAALHAARRVDDYSTAVRIFEGIKEKVESKKQYEAYLEELNGVREELGVNTKEELYPST
ncbi:COX5A-domain-containing protein [Phellopilus nigrolimitatus]|nr:COX5A-domain-containing protein [Phellopilus nigrolimitatus]